MSSNAIISYSLNAASRVFSSRDLFGSIMEFIRPEWVNPFFPSIEGALLEGREDLLGQKFEVLFSRMVGTTWKGNVYDPLDSYEIRTSTQLAEFMYFYKTNYEIYAEGSSFSSILCYLFTPFANYRMLAYGDGNDSMYSRLDIHKTMFYPDVVELETLQRGLLCELCERNDVERVCEYIRGIYYTRLPYSLGGLYDCWMDHTDRQCYDILYRALEIELDLLLEGDNVKRDVSLVDMCLRDILREWSSLGLNVERLIGLYEIRMNRKYMKLGGFRDVDDNFARLVQYSKVGCFEFFVRYEKYSYIQECLDCYERMSVSQLCKLNQWDSNMRVLVNGFKESSYILKKKSRADYYDEEYDGPVVSHENENEYDDLLGGVSELTDLEESLLQRLNLVLDVLIRN